MLIYTFYEIHIKTVLLFSNNLNLNMSPARVLKALRNNSFKRNEK